MPERDILDLRIPRSATALMQLLQLLVGKEKHRLWIGGVIAPEKLEAFACKMARRYPALTRNARQRSYDRRRGLAAMHMLVYPSSSAVHWWVVSDAGKGGLGEASSPDYRVARDAMAADGHITYGDYVLLYATKKDPRMVPDRRTGKPKRVFKDLSTWTWKLRSPVVNEVRAAIDDCCRQLSYGSEGSTGSPSWGLRGLLYAQRQRPLFSGVRNQVIELHRAARDEWGGVHSRWCGRHSALVKKYGKKAGALRPLNEVMARHLPKMPRLPVYDTPPRRLRSLLGSSAPIACMPTVSMEWHTGFNAPPNTRPDTGAQSDWPRAGAPTGGAATVR